jgi:energy-converting hydrogenase Eha subunit A
MPVICEGCGQRVPIPEGHRRNKIQCPCGVICPVPESARQEAEPPTPKRAASPSPPAIEQEAERWLLDDPPPPPPPSEPPSFHEPEPVAQPKPPPPTPPKIGGGRGGAARKPAVAAMRFPCRRCRQLIRRQGECPDCDGFVRSQTPQENEEPVWWPSVDTPEAKDEEEDSSPYTVEGDEDVKCPKCCFMLPHGSVLCVRCGFHLQERKKLIRSYQPMEREWETSASYVTRLLAYSGCLAVGLVLGLIGVFWGGADLGVFIGAFLLLAAMLAFLIGTFDRIHLTRDARGRVKLTKTWRVAFHPLKPRSIDVWSYEGIMSGRHRPVSPWDSWILYFLIVFGIIPGIIWWYLVFYKITYQVALSRDHGFPEYTVYSGGSEKQMKEIAYALRDASGLPYDEG